MFSFYLSLGFPLFCLIQESLFAQKYDPDLLKVVIKEAIEYWVGAGGGDADEMEEQVEGHHVICVLEHIHRFGHQTE